jgi:hypothetical protein
MESINAKFLENDLISGSDQNRNIVSKNDHLESSPFTSNDRLVIVHTIPKVQTSVEHQSLKFHKLLTTF